MRIILILTLLLTPTYTARFGLFNFPTNLLMVWVVLFWLIFSAWIIKNKKTDLLITHLKNTSKKFLALIILFFIAGVISLIINGFSIPKLGQFLILFIQPISVYFIAKFIYEQYPNAKHAVLHAIYYIVAVSGLYAIIQYITLLGLPTAYWGNSIEPKRAVAFFSHPNFYALWLSPLMALLIPDLGIKITSLKQNWFFIIAWILGGLGLALSFSRAGWLGLGVAIGVYTLIAGDKKIRKIIFITFILTTLTIIATPNLRYRFLLPFYGEKSAVSRLSLWNTGIKAIQESPVFGLGLTGFSNNWERLNTDPNLETHNFPHNIFLNFWVETGLLGLVSFVGMVVMLIYKGFKNRSNIFLLGTSLFLITIITQGQIDNPYFKNDLAMVFWIILALI